VFRGAGAFWYRRKGGGPRKASAVPAIRWDTFNGLGIAEDQDVVGRGDVHLEV
jgi:hypothetical protein